MVGKTALNKEMKHLNGAYFRTIMRQLKRRHQTKKIILTTTRLLTTKDEIFQGQLPAFPKNSLPIDLETNKQFEH